MYCKYYEARARSEAASRMGKLGTQIALATLLDESHI